MKYPKITIVLKKHEMPVLLQLMSIVTQPAGIQGVNSRLLICLMQGFYFRLKAQSVFVKVAYKVQVPLPEAMAFCEYWLGMPMKTIVSSSLINRIIGEFDQKTTSIIY